MGTAGNFTGARSSGTMPSREVATFRPWRFLLIIKVFSFLCFPVVINASGLKVEHFSNSAMFGEPSMVNTVLTTERVLVPETTVSAIVSGTITFPAVGTWQFVCSFESTSVGFVWLDGHLVCQDGNVYKLSASQSDNPLPIRRLTPLAFRAHLYRNKTKTMSTPMGFSMNWGLNGNTNGTRLAPIPSSALTEELFVQEKMRGQIQRRASKGWGNLLHHNMLAFTKLPAGIAMTTELCQLSSQKCVLVATPDGISRGNAYVRVGPYAIDRSYGQFYFGSDPSSNKSAIPFGNVSVSFTVGEGGDTLQLMVEPVQCHSYNSSDLVLRLSNRFLWHREGTVSTATHPPSSSFSSAVSSIVFQPQGMQATRVVLSAPFLHDSALPHNFTSAYTPDVFLALDNGSVSLHAGLATAAPPSPAQLMAVRSVGDAIATARASMAPPTSLNLRPLWRQLPVGPPSPRPQRTALQC